MTTYYIIGAGGRVLEELESNKSVEELGYVYIDGSRVMGIVPKQEMPSDANLRPLGRPTEAAGCMGYEDGPPMDKILEEGPQPPLEPISDKGRQE